MAKISIGLQLYTVREDCDKDFRGTVKKVAEMGYQGVELAGDGGLSSSEMKSASGGLWPPSGRSAYRV